jgi:hypothetical protein
MSRRHTYYGAVASYTNTLSTSFNGINQFVNNGRFGPGVTPFTALQFQRNDAFSINVWVKPTAYNGYIFFHGVATNRLYIQLLPGGNIRFQFENVLSGGTFQRIDSTATIPLNVWTKITCTYNGGGVSGYKMYFNNVLQAATFSGTATAVNTVTYSDFGFGAFLGATTSNFFRGNIDEATFWNIELSGAQINQILPNINPASLSFNANLLEHFRFGDGDVYPNITGKKIGYVMYMLNMTAANFVTDVP